MAVAGSRGGCRHQPAFGLVLLERPNVGFRGQHRQNALQGFPGHRCRIPFALWLLLRGQRSLSAVPPAEQLLPERAKSAARPSAPTCHLSRWPRCLAATPPCQVPHQRCQLSTMVPSITPAAPSTIPKQGVAAAPRVLGVRPERLARSRQGFGWPRAQLLLSLLVLPCIMFTRFEPKGHENGVQPRAEGTRGAAEWLGDSEAPSSSWQRLSAQDSAGKRCPVPSRWRRGDGGCGGAVLVPPAQPAPGCGNGAVAAPACISPATPLSAAFHIDYNSWFWLCFFCPFNNICCLGEEKQGTPPTGACTAPGPEGCSAAPHCPQPPVLATALELHPNWEKPLCHGLVLQTALSMPGFPKLTTQIPEGFSHPKIPSVPSWGATTWAELCPGTCCLFALVWLVWHGTARQRASQRAGLSAPVRQSKQAGYAHSKQRQPRRKSPPSPEQTRRPASALQEQPMTDALPVIKIHARAFGHCQPNYSHASLPRRGSAHLPQSSWPVLISPRLWGCAGPRGAGRATGAARQR